MSDAALGFGIQLARGAGTGPETFTTLGDLVDFTPATKTRETKDATHHGVANRVRKFIGGLRDLGEASFTLHYKPGGTAATALNTDYMSDEPVHYQVTFPGNTSESFYGLITELSPATPLDDVMKISGKIKLSGG